VVSYLRLPDGRSFNELLVAEGYAVPLTIPLNVRYAERFTRLARRARESAAGLWSSRACDGDPDRPAG
jgi:micrococcal nuclease